MNAVDLLFIVLLVGGLVLGFFQGTIRLAIAIVALYIGIILASLYFQIVGNWFHQRFGTTILAGQIVSFTLIMLVSFLLLTIAGLYTFRYARVPPGLEFVDRIIGTLLGLLLGALFVGMFALVLRDLFVAQNAAAALTFPAARWFQDRTRTSVLMPFFINVILPLVYTTLKPILPAESTFIFQGL
jgi:membrane protein required for colicin V production